MNVRRTATALDLEALTVAMLQAAGRVWAADRQTVIDVRLDDETGQIVATTTRLEGTA